MNWNNKKLWKMSGITASCVGAGALGFYSWPLLVVVAVLAAFVSLGFFMEPRR